MSTPTQSHILQVSGQICIDKGFAGSNKQKDAYERLDSILFFCPLGGPIFLREQETKFYTTIKPY
jgi:hypothetical protein